MDIEQEGLLAGRIPVGILFALAMQLAGALVWASHLEARVAGVEKQTAHTVLLNERFARLEERLDNLKVETSGVRQEMQVLNQRIHDEGTKR